MAVTLAVLTGALLWLLRKPVLHAYASDPAVVAAALPLVLFVAFYQAFDAVQVMTAFILRAYKIALIPTLIYAGSLWGIGLGGGYVLGFGLIEGMPAFTRGAAASGWPTASAWRLQACCWCGISAGSARIRKTDSGTGRPQWRRPAISVAGKEKRRLRGRLIWRSGRDSNPRPPA